MRGVFAILLGALTTISPATAVEVSAGASGTIDVYPDLGACATLAFPRPVTAVGAFTSAGAVTGPGTAVAPVRGATAIAVTGATSWFGCLPDAYAGATAGAAIYTLSVTTLGNEYVQVLTCDVRRGVVTCR